MFVKRIAPPLTVFAAASLVASIAYVPTASGATSRSVATSRSAAPAATSALLNCTDGTYNTRLLTTDACAWGNVKHTRNSAGLYRWSINLVLVDRTYSNCAAVDYRTGSRSVIGIIWSPYRRMASVCGRGKTKPAQYNASPNVPIQIRVCTPGVKCTSWRTPKG